MHLIVLADRAHARFLTADLDLEGVEEVADLIQPESQLAGRDVYTDGSGRKQGGGVSPQTNGRDIAAQRFAKTVAAEVGKRGAGVERIIVAASPSFLGALRGELDPNTQHKVVAEISKNLVRSPIHEMRATLVKNLPPLTGMP